MGSRRHAARTAGPGPPPAPLPADRPSHAARHDPIGRQLADLGGGSRSISSLFRSAPALKQRDKLPPGGVLLDSVEVPLGRPVGVFPFSGAAVDAVFAFGGPAVDADFDDVYDH